MRIHNILLDTNIFFSTENIRAGQIMLSGNLRWLIDAIIKSGLEAKLFVEIPEIVFLEFKRHILEEVQDKTKKLEWLMESGRLPGFRVQKIESDTSIDEYVEEICKDFRDQINSKFSIGFNVPVSSGNLDALIERAISKRPPFEGKDKSSDKGFKDAVLWESLLSFKRENPYTTIYLYTKDARFNNDLSEEYMALFKEKLAIIRTEEEVLKLIDEISIMKNPEIEKEFEEVQALRAYTIANGDLLRNIVLESVEKKSWLGDGMKFKNLYSVKVDSILPSKYSSYSVSGDYYVKVIIESDIEYDDFVQSFNAPLHFDVKLIENNHYKFVLTGIGGHT
ncbi:hypothetical protein SAMN05421804_10971 [Proteiniclasticum ruminis]|uniref:DUF4935 domain-containing protein n=2 Tax=Proteiniclasticum ruminis TaxID=398199 RepID=A0A1G8RSR9_9CLOT|nr:PIN domain-containing protein [Proteiniclasticum ruminis]SDJ20018.1 hypothetical protein SAMN05421804_10971 [Proteiniclasticum ruminis]